MSHITISDFLASTRPCGVVLDKATFTFLAPFDTLDRKPIKLIVQIDDIGSNRAPTAMITDLACTYLEIMDHVNPDGKTFSVDDFRQAMQKITLDTRFMVSDSGALISRSPVPVSEIEQGFRELYPLIEHALSLVVDASLDSNSLPKTNVN